MCATPTYYIGINHENITKVWPSGGGTLPIFSPVTRQIVQQSANMEDYCRTNKLSDISKASSSSSRWTWQEWSLCWAQTFWGLECDRNLAYSTIRAYVSNSINVRICHWCTLHWSLICLALYGDKRVICDISAQCPWYMIYVIRSYCSEKLQLSVVNQILWGNMLNWQIFCQSLHGNRTMPENRIEGAL